MAPQGPPRWFEWRNLGPTRHPETEEESVNVNVPPKASSGPEERRAAGQEKGSPGEEQKRDTGPAPGKDGIHGADFETNTSPSPTSWSTPGKAL
ncbi:UNVERIFIED_CONTAM: hypothetical protein HHA_452230 [Hammondia hammondi]|eukprot:XP_008885285.1 hypothetical protein HHA_452230 [Hammondia hammondi]